MSKFHSVLDKGFTVLQVVIVLVVIGVLATLAIVKVGAVKEEAYVTAMKNDLRNFATAEEQYFHASGDGYGSPDQVESQEGLTYSDGVSADTASHSQDHWYLRVQHADTDVKCELFYTPSEEVPNVPNRIICPGDPLLMPVDVDLATNGIEFMLNTDDATYSAKVQQADGAVLDFEVHVRHPNDSTSLLCRQSRPREVLCTGAIPVEQEGQYTITATGTIGGADPSGSGELSARDSVAYEVINRPPNASLTFEPDEPQTDEAVAFDGSSSSDADGSVASYSWDFGDGGTATGPTPSYSYDQNGDYTVGLTVIDNLGKKDTTAQVVSVSNRAPTADLTFSPTKPQTDETIRLDGSTSEDPDGTIPDYRWRFDGGTATNWGTFTTETSFGSDGDHTLALQVRDDDGAVSTWVEDTVTVSNQAPAASFTFSPSSPETDETISLDASGSSDPDGSISSYSWDFGDGTTATGATPDHSYSDDGDYTVTLTVTDDDGATGSTSQTVTVINQSPTISSLSCDDPKETGQTVTCTAKASDADGSVVNYNWGNSFNGRKTTGSATPSEAARSFASDGTYTVAVQAKDDDDVWGPWETVDVTVSNQPPTADFTFSPSDPTVGESVTFDGGPSFDSDGSVQWWNWDFGDGSSASGERVSHTFSTSGPHDVRLTVDDDDEESAGETKTVSVEAATYACDFDTEVISQVNNSSLSGFSSWTVNSGEYQGEDLEIIVSASEDCGSGSFGSFCSNWSPGVTGTSGADSWSKPGAAGESCGIGWSSGSGTGDPDGVHIASSSSNGSCGGNTLTVDVPNPPSDESNWSFSYTIQFDDAGYQAEHTVTCSRQ